MSDIAIITATTPLVEVPVWALQQRHLFRLINEAGELFESRFASAEREHRVSMRLTGDDGAVDLYEAYATWPVYYRLGGAAGILSAAKSRWDRAVDQLIAQDPALQSVESSDGLQEVGLSELFHALCAADPDDETLRQAAMRSAQIALSFGNHQDPRGGKGLGVLRLGDAHPRVDVAANLSSALSILNAWLCSVDDSASGPSSKAVHEKCEIWIRAYVDAWQSRATAANDPYGGRTPLTENGDTSFRGNHYRWIWPHGLVSIQAAASIACLTESIVLATTKSIALAWRPLQSALSSADKSVQDRWLVPHRYGPEGWFDFHPLSMDFPIWLWWLSRQDSDQTLLANLQTASSYDSDDRSTHSGRHETHEMKAWFDYLAGNNPLYPEEALSRSIEHVNRRIALLNNSAGNSAQNSLRSWSQRNPVTTEVLLQLTTGSPLSPGHSGVQPARIVIGDSESEKPGLPPDVAGLVDALDGNRIGLTLVNLSPIHQRTVTVQAGAFGEDQFVTVRSNSGCHRAGSARLTVTLPPSRQVHLDLEVNRWAYPATYKNFSQ